jgi:tagatose 1,6-diphosphate aldolase
MGEIELRLGNTHHIRMYAGHIGYEVDPPYRGRHYAARAVKLLLPLARHEGIEVVWITSLATPIILPRAAPVSWPGLN